MVRLLFLGACRLHGFGHRMTAGTGEMKCELALNSIAPGYRLRYAVGYRLRYAPAIAFDMPRLTGFDTPWLSNRLGNGISNLEASTLKWLSVRLAGVTTLEEPQ